MEMPYCELNEIKSKYFLIKTHKFSNNNFRIVMVSKTRNLRSLFHLTLLKMGLFGAADGWYWVWQKAPTPTPAITCHKYPTIKSFHKVITYLKKVQQIYKPRDTPLKFC